MRAGKDSFYGLTLANDNDTVLLIMEADTRRPSVHYG